MRFQKFPNIDHGFNMQMRSSIWLVKKVTGTANMHELYFFHFLTIWGPSSLYVSFIEIDALNKICFHQCWLRECTLESSSTKQKQKMVHVKSSFSHTIYEFYYKLLQPNCENVNTKIHTSLSNSIPTASFLQITAFVNYTLTTPWGNITQVG